MSTLTLWQKFWMGMAVLILGYYGFSVFSATFFRSSPLTVVGVGRQSVKPEQVSFIVARASRGTDATSAINEGDAGIKVLIDTATSVGGEGTEIQRSFYQLVPTGTAFQVVNAFSVKTKAVDKINELVKSLYRDGATTVSNISFTSLNQKETEQKTRELAVKDARDQAKKIAKAAGKRLGRLLSISDDNAAAASTIGSSSDTASQTTLGSIDITKRVSVVYEIW